MGATQIFRIALALLFDYVSKRLDELPQVLHLLTDEFGFKHTSYRLGFRVQQAVIDGLWKYTNDGQDDLYSKIFLAVAKEYLKINFHTIESKGRHAFSMINFRLPATLTAEKRSHICEDGVGHVEYHLKWPESEYAGGETPREPFCVGQVP